MTLCRPRSALSEKPRRNHWRLLGYETENFSGVMLVAGRNTAAPEIAYPVKQKGWHAVYFGLRSYDESTRLQVRLKRDSTFSMIHHQRGAKNRLDDYFWRYVEFSGDDEIVLRQYCRQLVPDDPSSIANRCWGVWLAYIKTVPLSDGEVSALLRERRSGQHRRLFAHNDAWSYTYTYRATAPSDIRREIEPFRETDFSRIYWEAGGGDRMNYPSKLSRIVSTDEWIKDPYRVGDRLAKETWQTWRDQGIDPLQVAADYAHEIGLEFHTTYRPAGFHYPVPHDELNTGGVYDQHPEWRGRDRNGRPTPRLSYAFPEVRQVVIDFLKEMAEYPIDGVCIAYNRRPPLLEYEAPVVEGFQAKFGEDPRRLDEKDPRWLSYRTTFLTQFMREARRALNDVARKKNRRKPFELTAIVMSSKAENLYFAMDVETWIKEGLVDTMIPYSSAKRLDSSKDSWVNPKDAEFFYRITRGTKCKLALNLMPRRISADEYRRRAHVLYQAGAEHFFFWDTNSRYDFSPSWTVLSRLGHKEELEAWTRAGSPKFDPPGTTLKRLGDWDLSYDTPG